MTVIAALADGRTVWMAADTATNYQGTMLPTGARKIRRVTFSSGAQILLAGSGNGGILPAATRALQHQTGGSALPVDPADWPDLDEWADETAHHLTTALAALTPPLAGPAPDSHSASLDGAFLIAREGRLWYLFAHQATPVSGQMAALGVGCDYALGWMAGAMEAYTSPKPERLVVQDAVTAACQHTAYCAAPHGPLVEILTPAEQTTADA